MTRKQDEQGKRRGGRFTWGGTHDGWITELGFHLRGAFPQVAEGKQGKGWGGCLAGAWHRRTRGAAEARRGVSPAGQAGCLSPILLTGQLGILPFWLVAGKLHAIS